MFQAKARHARLMAGAVNPSICSLLSIGVCLKDKAVTTGLDSTPSIGNYPMSQGLLNLASNSFQCLHLLFSHHKTGLGISMLSDPSTIFILHHGGLGALFFSKDSDEQH